MKYSDLTAYQKDVYAAKICPYCKSSTKVVSQETIYGKKFSNRSMICCINYPKCDAYVGTHDNGEALGRLAKSNLRIKKKETHNAFDRLWQLNYMTRDEAYTDLANFLGLDRQLTHIGFMNIETLQKTERWALDRYIEFHREENKIPKNYIKY